MNILATPNFLPPGISVQRDDLATTREGDPCIRVMVRRDIDRLTVVFEVPIYKKLVWVRMGGFLFPKWKQIEATDEDRIDSELRDRGYAYVRELAEAPIEATV